MGVGEARSKLSYVVRRAIKNRVNKRKNGRLARGGDTKEWESGVKGE